MAQIYQLMKYIVLTACRKSLILNHFLKPPSFNDNDLERLNSRYLKTLTYDKLTENFDVKYNEKFLECNKN